ncbi:MAG: FAD-dependent oxidoreductase [Epsilonproteobacteria bacterium]|nr:FAD-dependent oxidoreductase [Campylobacterota bacterium]
MKTYDYDVIIVGSGGAAFSCAIAAKQKGLSVLIITKSSPTASQTVQAQGGINGVLGDTDDTVEAHIKDTLKAACQIGDDETISFMCQQAKETIEWLDNLGVPFSRDKNNHIARRKLGGALYSRACYSSDYTGLKILHTLYDTIVKLKIYIKENCMLLDLLTQNNTAFGITYLDIKTTQIKQVTANNIVFATGGYGGVYHGFTTNSKDTTADGIIAGFRAGVNLENMEFIQFHPTALVNKFILISESARGEGGYLVTQDGKRFVDELLPRDIVAREIYKKLLNNENVYLDLRHISKEKLLHLLPQEYKLIFKFTSLEMDKDLIPITPATHYTMGGLKSNIDSKTSLNNLYAIGEVASNGVHGANRLGGNSLLEIILFGKKLGERLESSHFSNKTFESSILKENILEIETIFNNTSTLDFYQYRDKLAEIMFSNVGLFRTNESLSKGLDFVQDTIDNIHQFGIEDKSKIYNTNLKDFLEFKNCLLCAKTIILSALNRCESRGAHYRNDFPISIDSFKKSTIIDNKFNIK